MREYNNCLARHSKIRKSKFLILIYVDSVSTVNICNSSPGEAIYAQARARLAREEKP